MLWKCYDYKVSQTSRGSKQLQFLEQAKQYPVGSKRQDKGQVPGSESYRRGKRAENIRSALLKSSDRIKGRKQFSECNSAAAMEMSA